MRWEHFWMPAIVAASLAIGMTAHAQQPSGTPGGAQDRVAAFKQSLQQGLGAIRRYQWIAPNPDHIQAAKEAGRITVNPPSGGTVRVIISQYLKPSDSLTIDLDPATNQIIALGVNSYLDTQEDVITLVVQMNTLPDGALYAAQTTLDAKAKNIRVLIQNAGHRPVP
jgi:hypothetical protein